MAKYEGYKISDEDIEDEPVVVVEEPPVSEPTEEEPAENQIQENHIAHEAKQYGVGGKLVYNNENAQQETDIPLDEIPPSIFGLDYDESHEKFSKSQKVSDNALTIGIVAASCEVASYMTSCCCGLASLCSTAAFIMGIVAVVLGIRGIVLTKDLGVNKKAVIGLILGIIVLLIKLFTTVVALLYYTFTIFGPTLIRAFQNAF